MKSALATALRGIEIENGWVIEEPRAKCAGATGACHAIGFTAKHADGGRAFVKVLDLTVDPTLRDPHEFTRIVRFYLLTKEAPVPTWFEVTPTNSTFQLEQSLATLASFAKPT